MARHSDARAVRHRAEPLHAHHAEFGSRRPADMCCAVSTRSWNGVSDDRCIWTRPTHRAGSNAGGAPRAAAALASLVPGHPPDDGSGEGRLSLQLCAIRRVARTAFAGPGYPLVIVNRPVRTLRRYLTKRFEAQWRAAGRVRATLSRWRTSKTVTFFLVRRGGRSKPPRALKAAHPASAMRGIPAPRKWWYSRSSAAGGGGSPGCAALAGSDHLQAANAARCEEGSLIFSEPPIRRRLITILPDQRRAGCSPPPHLEV